MNVYIYTFICMNIFTYKHTYIYVYYIYCGCACSCGCVVDDGGGQDKNTHVCRSLLQVSFTHQHVLADASSTMEEVRVKTHICRSLLQVSFTGLLNMS